MSTSNKYTIILPSYYETSEINNGAIIEINNWQLSINKFLYNGSDVKEQVLVYVGWGYA